MIVSGPTYRDQAVPIRLELPDGQGWLVAAKGKTFAWTEDGVARTARDAALIPPAAAVRADGRRRRRRSRRTDARSPVHCADAASVRSTATMPAVGAYGPTC